MAVPFIDLRRFEPDFAQRWAELTAEITRTTQFVGGPIVGKLEERLREVSGATAVIGCANGTDAIQLALRAAGIGRDDLVLLPDATFWGTYEAVYNVGARPITVDIDLTDLQMDFDLFCEAIETYRPKAAILVHLYGWASARLKDFRRFAKEKGVILIEDGAQAYGTLVDGESIYKDAFLSTVSFYPAKVLGSCGDAGAVYTSDSALGDVVRKLGNHGRTSHYGHGYVGWNSRLGGFDAGYLGLCMDYMDARLASRRASAARYREFFQAEEICHVPPPSNITENGYLAVSLIEPDKRAEVEAVFKERGIGFSNVYPGAMSKQPAAKETIHATVGGEKADLLSRSVLNPPLFAYMRDEELDEVMEGYRAALAKVS